MWKERDVEGEMWRERCGKTEMWRESERGGGDVPPARREDRPLIRVLS